MTQELVIAALDMALLTRKAGSVIHHSDQGSQYTSIAFGQRCKEAGVQPSMGSVGDAYDNAMAESLFATLECELIERRTWQTKAQARLAIFTWIESWYNPRRRHSGLGQMSPINFETRHEEQKKHADKKAHEAQARAGAQHGLATGCFALVDKPPHGFEGASRLAHKQGPMDNPALVRCLQS
jgi:putative transposase